MSDYDFDVSLWLSAIEKADSWCDTSAYDTKSPNRSSKENGPKGPNELKKTRRPKKGDRVSNPELLLKLLRSGAPMPQRAQELLADLLSRHSLKLKTTRTPAYTQSESEIDALVLMEFVDEFKGQPRWHYGPITKAEMEDAVKVMQQRARAKGRGHRKYDGRTAAITMREERGRLFSDYYGLDYKRFMGAVDGKDGSVNRAKAQRI